jgi:hypothetical protein
MIIANHSFNDYTLLSELDRDEFDVIIKYSTDFYESVDTFKIGELTEKSFGVVKDIQYGINNNTLTWSEYFDYVNQITLVTVEELKATPMLKLIQFRNYLVTEVIRINELEKILLSHEATAEEQEANLEEFEKFGAYLQIRALTNNDITKHEQVRQIKYSLCLIELRVRQLEREYEIRLNEIFKRKNRIN